MLSDQRLEHEKPLRTPESLLPQTGALLPAITPETLLELQAAGWSRIGLMVAFVDTEGAIMLMRHNQSAKNSPGVLGPLGETSQRAGPVIEQPLETLFRGVQEELGIQYPSKLEMSMRETDGWVINRWPVGASFLGRFACAISFPIFIPDKVKDYLLAVPHGTEEIDGIYGFVQPAKILDIDETLLRDGVKPWLHQLDESGLLQPSSTKPLTSINFSSIYAAGLEDISLE